MTRPSRPMPSAANCGSHGQGYRLLSAGALSAILQISGPHWSEMRSRTWMIPSPRGFLPRGQLRSVCTRQALGSPRRPETPAVRAVGLGGRRGSVDKKGDHDFYCFSRSPFSRLRVEGPPKPTARTARFTWPSGAHGRRIERFILALVPKIKIKSAGSAVNLYY
jgi:hypothetical protein